MVSHAALPVVDATASGHRVYFSGRDGRGRGHIGRVDVDVRRRRVLAVSPAPVLSPGPLGAFDDHGVTSACRLDVGGRTYHYYTGWNLGVTVPFYLAIGLAIDETGNGAWRRVAEGPILGRTPVDPYLTASPCVRREGDRLRMWYVSGTGWADGSPRPQHRYHIRYAESRDGVTWERAGRVCIDFRDDGEHAIARPCVLRDGDLYRMWYCHRGSAYRLGYAESRDGLTWERLDERAGLDVSPDGWDAEMIAYPFVFDVDGERYMLYNGNGYGRTGIGLAVLESD